MLLMIQGGALVVDLPAAKPGVCPTKVYSVPLTPSDINIPHRHLQLSVDFSTAPRGLCFARLSQPHNLSLTVTSVRKKPLC